MNQHRDRRGNAELKKKRPEIDDMNETGRKITPAKM